MSASILDSLLVELGFEYDKKDLDKFKSDLSESTDQLKMISKWAASAAAAITGLVVATTSATDEQGKLSNQIGESIDTLSAWEFAAQIAGDSADSLRGSMSGLAGLAGQAARGVGAGLEAFGILGVNILDVNGEIKQTSDLMLEVSERLRGLNKAQQVDLTSQLGLGGTLRLLQLGPEAIRELVDEARTLGVTTAEDAAISADFQDSLVRVWAVIKDISRAITKSLAPAMEETYLVFVDWWKVNKDIIKLKLPEWINNAAIALRLLTIAALGFISIKILGMIVSGITLIRSLTFSIAALNASVLLTPILISSAIAALLLLVEDAKVFFEGGESFIGDMLEMFPEWESQIRSVAGALIIVKDVLVEIADLAKATFESVDKITKGKNKAVNRAVLGVTSTIGSIGAAFQKDPVSSLDPSSVAASKAKAQIAIDNVVIRILGGNDTAENIASRTLETFQQTSQDLTSGLEQ